jgi:hypothetical protein
MSDKLKRRFILRRKFPERAPKHVTQALGLKFADGMVRLRESEVLLEGS